MAGLSEAIKSEARALGFDLVGIAAAGPAESHERYTAWLEQGYHAEMGYLARPDAVARRADLREVLPSARSAIVVGLNYYEPAAEQDPPNSGRVARYAWGDDYHDVIAARLRRLAEFIEKQIGHPFDFKVCVDTSAVIEREWAVRAGLGWIGKNTVLINPRAGSWFLLGELVLDLELEYDRAAPTDHCGVCTRCLEACPTQCILPGRILDASRCISYLTIELRGSTPEHLAPEIGDWVFGCDVCQEVCPWNRFARPADENVLQPRHATLDLVEIAALSEEEFRARFAGSPIRRAKHQGLVRNARIVAANHHADT